MFRSALLTVSFALIFAASCTKKDKDQGPAPSTGSAATTGSAAAGSDSAMTGSDTGSAAGSAMGSDAGSAAGSGSAGSAAGSAAAAATHAETEFEKLSQEDKVKFMKTKVMPPMKAAFQKFDPKEFANFTCKTCHGKDPQKSKYEMPNAELPKLDFEKLKQGHEKEWVEFMSKVVKPEMAKILGEHEMTEAEPTGFGCLECHMQKK